MKNMKQIFTGFCIPIILAALMVAPAVAQSEDVPAAESTPSDTWLIQIVLLAGSTKGPSNLNDLPQNTRKAVQDIQQFLPFKSFKVWDTALVRSAHHARGILSTPLGNEYNFELTFRRENQEGKARLMFNHVQITERSRSSLKRELGPGVAPPAEREIIRTSFAVEEGETIVVGSSRLNGGGEALLVLLTAIP